MTKMMMNGILVTALNASAVLAQSQTRPAFEVASVRASPDSSGSGVTAGVRIDGAQVRASFLTLRDYIAIAYQVKLYQVSAPDWMGSQRFEIMGTLPEGAPTTQMPEMMRSLLEDRFQLKVHREKKDFPVYVLEVVKGALKLKESAPDTESADAKAPQSITGSGSNQGISVNMGRGSSYTFANNRFEAKKVTVANFANILERFLDRPIVDMTGLTGSYDVAIDLTPEEYRTMLIRAGVNAGVVLPPEALRLLDGASITSLMDGLQKLGLRLDARKAPLDMIVIDDARKTPTEN